MKKLKNRTKVLLFYSFILLLFLFGTMVGNRAITAFSEITDSNKLHCIVIDAGHGGEDGGAVSCSGKSESMFNLQIALRLDDLFHLLGYRTAMVRNTDKSVYTSGETIAQKKISDLKHRVHIAHQKPNAILISIHQNTFPEEKYSGAQVFYANNHQSVNLANAVQTAIVTALQPGNNRKEKQGSGIYILDKLRIPGILIECGFLSNANEEILLRTPQYQKKLCSVISASVASFLSST